MVGNLLGTTPATKNVGLKLENTLGDLLGLVDGEVDREVEGEALELTDGLTDDD